MLAMAGQLGRSVGWAALLMLLLGVRGAHAEDLATGAPVTVAVAPVRPILAETSKTGMADPLARAAEDALSAGISEIPGVELLDRVQLGAVLREQKLAASGILDAGSAARAGKLLKARVLVMGKIQPSGDGWVCAFKAIHCADARVIWATEVHGKGAQVAAQAGLLADGLRNRLFEEQVLKRSAPSVDTRPLLALRHHERARALAAQGAYPEATAEEISALILDPSMSSAELGFLEGLEKAGFSQLARAEARNLEARLGKAPIDPRLQRLLNLSEPAKPEPVAAPETRREASLRKLMKWLDEQLEASSDPRQCALDAIQVGLWLAKDYAKNGRDRRALGQYQKTLQLLWKLRATDMQVMLDDKFYFEDLPFPPAVRLIEHMAYYRSRDGLYHHVTFLEPAVKQGPPEGAIRPTHFYEVVLPIQDQAFIQRPKRHHREPPAYDYVFRADFSLLPKNGQVVAVHFISEQSKLHSEKGRATALTEEWKSGEATWENARAGQKWVTVPVEGGDYVGLREVLTRLSKQPQPTTGIRMSRYATVQPRRYPHQLDPLLPLKYLIVKWFPGQEKPPAHAKLDVLTYQQEAVFCALKRDEKGVEEWTRKGMKAVEETVWFNARDHWNYRNFFDCLTKAVRGSRP